MTKSRANNSLLFIFSLTAVVGAGLGLTGCGESFVAAKPDLPQSVSPGWVRKSFERAEPPSGLDGAGKKECWKAEYAGAVTAEVWTCGYAAESGAFDAAQRFGSAGDQVKFQVGKYLAVVRWSGGAKTEVTALVRAIQKALAAK